MFHLLLNFIDSTFQSVIDLHSKEVELRNNVEKSRDAISEDLRKAQLELMNTELQVYWNFSFSQYFCSS